MKFISVQNNLNDCNTKGRFQYCFPTLSQLVPVQVLGIVGKIAAPYCVLVGFLLWFMHLFTGLVSHV